MRAAFDHVRELPAGPRADAWLGAVVLVGAAALASVAFPASAGDVAPEWRFSGVPRVVAVGDVHGAYEELVTVLEGTGIASPAGDWTGGTAHLVMLGDLVGRGPRSREVLDLVRRLQRQARAAGGSVHYLLGNHEVMNLTGDLRYVSDEGLAAWADGDESRRRREYLRNLLRRAAAANADPRDVRARITGDFRHGLFSHQRAFARDGNYGAWLLEQRILVVVNDVAFVHGGLSPLLLAYDPEDVNRLALEGLDSFVKAREQLLDSGVLRLDMGFADSLATARGLAAERRGAISGRAACVAKRLVEASRSLALRPDGPLWYRGTALGPVEQERATVQRVLAHVGARSAVIGHTPTHTGRLTARFGGMVVLADTAMLYAQSNGRPSAVVVEDGRSLAYYPGEPLLPLTARRWEIEEDAFASLHEVEQFLRTAPILDAEPLGAGTTGASRAYLADDGRRGEAVFKTVDEEIPCPPEVVARSCRDSYRHEVAAYLVDRALDLGMVPPTVLRTVDGVEGSLQLWVEGAVNERARREEDLRPDNPELFERELARAGAFDYLVLNPQRNGTNILVTRRDWNVHLIDHSAAFVPSASAPEVLDEGLEGIDPELLGRLTGVDRDLLRYEVRDLLGEFQVAALFARLDQLVSSAGGRRGR